MNDDEDMLNKLNPIKTSYGNANACLQCRNRASLLLRVIKTHITEER